MPDGSNRPVSARRVTLMRRAGCHLCDDAHAALEALRAEIDFSWEAVDVDASEELQDEYGDRVPVILIDGREHGYWRVETERLRSALTA